MRGPCAGCSGVPIQIGSYHADGVKAIIDTAMIAFPRESISNKLIKMTDFEIR
jgi:hypothetical protein